MGWSHLTHGVIGQPSGLRLSLAVIQAATKRGFLPEAEPSSRPDCRRSTATAPDNWMQPSGRVRRRPALPLTAVLECAIDVGCRCALWPSGDAHWRSRLSAGAATSFGLAAPFARGVRGAQAVTVATPQAEGLVRARGQVCLRTPAPALQGSLPIINPWREGPVAPISATILQPFVDSGG